MQNNIPNNIQNNNQSEVTSHWHADFPPAGQGQTPFLAGLGRNVQAIATINNRCATIQTANHLAQTLRRELGAYLFNQRLFNPGIQSRVNQQICIQALQDYQAVNPASRVPLAQELIESYMTVEELRQLGQ